MRVMVRTRMEKGDRNDVKGKQGGCSLNIHLQEEEKELCYDSCVQLL